MWELFVDEAEVPELPPATRRIFLQFVNCANRKVLHPLDWRRFYRFVRFCHAKRVKLTSHTLCRLLVRGHFAESKAEYLADVYERCRELLATR